MDVQERVSYISSPENSRTVTPRRASRTKRTAPASAVRRSFPATPPRRSGSLAAEAGTRVRVSAMHPFYGAALRTD